MSTIYERLRQRHGQNSQGSGRPSKFWRPQVGKQQVRFMTFMKDGVEEFEVEECWHYKVIKGEQKSSMVCGGPNCPICALQGKVPDSVWARIKPSKRYLVNAILRGGNEDGSDRQVIANIPTTVLRAACEVVSDEDYTSALSKEQGIDLKITRTGEGLDTRYRVTPVPTYSSWGADYVPEDLTKVVAKPKTLEELEAVAATYLNESE